MPLGNRRINIIITRRGAPQIGDDMENFARMLNFVSARDTNRTALQVFRWVLQNSAQDISSSEMGRAVDMNRLTCLHHLKRMEELGIVRNVDGRYVVETESMEQYIDRLENEAKETFAALRQLAKKIDEKYARKEIKIR
jgi:DNA-binding HxlR family transcriptional regulator